MCGATTSTRPGTASNAWNGCSSSPWPAHDADTAGGDDMTLLTVWPDTDPDTVEVRTEDPEEITDLLKQLGVRFNRWELQELPEEPTSEEVLAAYRTEV